MGYPARFLLLYYSLNALIVSFQFSRLQRRLGRIRLAIQKVKEDINIANNEGAQVSKNKIALQEKIRRYKSLKIIIEEINKTLSLDSIAENLTSIAFSLISEQKGVALLYMADSRTRTLLSIFKSKKESKGLIIKAKEGDIFDAWVVRHASPILVEDIKRDFRFDSEKLKNLDGRPLASLIAAPLMSENKFLGVLRLDHHEANFFTQDDLRFLSALCDVGAVALENGVLFEKTQELATHDELTGLYTKGYFFQRLKEELQRSHRQKHNLSLLMLDIDFFKKYNDAFGHTAGDVVLRSIGKTITAALKDASCIVCRFGGEEFCVALVDTDKEGALVSAERIRSFIEKTKVTLRRTESSVTVSVGVSSFPSDSQNADELVFKADRALYDAKEKGRNRVCAAP